MTSQSTRRDFLATLGVGAAALAAGHSAAARATFANETINVACIGTGGRCRQLMPRFSKIGGARIIGVCDVWDVHLQAGRQLAEPNCFATKDYREVLDRSDVDAVLIATPDHWHVPITIDACDAGKDVYVEKPLTHKLDEGQAVIDAQNRSGRIVQVGMQQRSMPQFHQGKRLIDSNRLGDVHKVHLTWNRNVNRAATRPNVDPKTVDWQRFLGNAPKQPFDPFRFRHWRWFWDFGGGILTDLMVHFIDVANWYLGLEHPATATTIGDHFMAQNLWQTPDTIQTLLQYPEQQVQVYFEGTFINARNAAMLEFMGSEATLYLDRGRYELHPERRSKVKYEQQVLGSGARGLDFYDNPDGEMLHLIDWIESIRSRKRPNAPAEAGVTAVLAAHLANQAYRQGKVVNWPG